MKVLVATKETQGWRKNDFSWADEGELVKQGSECDGEAVDGACGCRRAMVGVKTGKATTTMKVVEMDITREAFTETIRQSQKAGGWYDEKDVEGAEVWVKEIADEMIRLAEYFKLGSIVEKRGAKFQTRETEADEISDKMAGWIVEQYREALEAIGREPLPVDARILKQVIKKYSPDKQIKSFTTVTATIFANATANAKNADEAVKLLPKRMPSKNNNHGYPFLQKLWDDLVKAVGTGTHKATPPYFEINEAIKGLKARVGEGMKFGGLQIIAEVTRIRRTEAGTPAERIKKAI